MMELPEDQNQATTETRLANLYQTISKWLEVQEDYEAIDVVLAAALDRKIKGDPLWLQVISTSGGGKSEILRMLYGLPYIYKFTNLTPKAIISGKVNEDGVAVRGHFKEMDGKVAICPDFTEVLQKPAYERDQIFGQFRNLYDGEATNLYGTEEKSVSAPCHIGLIISSTPAIDLYSQQAVVLGERFLKLRVKFDVEKSEERAIEISDKLEEARAELAQATKEFMDGVQIREYPLDEAIKKKIMIYGRIISRLRISSMRQPQFDTTEFVPIKENATRLNQQLIKLARGLAMVREHDRITEYDMATVFRVALDTILPVRKEVVLELQRTNELMSTSEIVANIQTRSRYMTQRKVVACLQYLTEIGVIEQSQEATEHNESRYKLGAEMHGYFASLTALLP